MAKEFDIWVSYTSQSGNPVSYKINGTAAYSVEKYINTLKEIYDGDQKLCTLCDAVLAYGKATTIFVNDSDITAPEYTGTYATISNSPVDSSILLSGILTSGTSYSKYNPDESGTTAKFTTANLSLGSKVSIMAKISIKGIDSSKVSVSYKIGESGSVTNITPTFDGNNGTIKLPAMSPDEFDNVYWIILKVDGEEVQVLKYSANTYCYRLENKVEQTDINKNLARAIYAYGKAAENYLASAS